MGVLSQHPSRYILKGHYQFIPNAPNFICLGVINIQVKHDLLRGELSSFLNSLLPGFIVPYMNFYY